MPLEIVGGFMQFIGENLVDPESGDPISLAVWDGEVPRVDTAGNPINPNVGNPGWPAVCVDMTDGGFDRQQYIGTAPYDDHGDIVVQVWGTGRAQVMGVLGPIEALLESVTNQAAIPLVGTVNGAPAFVIMTLLRNWTCRQLADVRLAQSQLCYLGRLVFNTRVHGALNSE